ncbi:translational GTPase TypA [Candidatus Berkelbacteria bacterium]|nr:translational GTPase TypA [Candidatus Berkelbacteria bacterium]
MNPASHVRNVAIIAHVDHGKTTLVDGLLKQSKMFRDNEAVMGQELIMDSNDQERERGITILAKQTAVTWGEYTINIIDTPGHADFGGEVERTLNLADGAILVIDAKEGPMPQTKFVLTKALELGLAPIVVVNKIDKPDARVEEVLELTNDLFLDLASDPSQLEFPVFYAVAREGKAWAELPADRSAPADPSRLASDEADLTPIFEGIITHVPAPKVETGTFQLLVTALDRDNYQGKYAIGRIHRGSVKAGQTVALITESGAVTTHRIDKVMASVGLKRVEVPEASAGNIVALTGIAAAGIGDTLADPNTPEALPRIQVEEPTLKMAMGANTSPFAGREGQFVTSRQLLERIERELETNVAIRMEHGEAGEYIVSGRGELHLSVFIETMRREGYELQVGKPQVITKEIDGELVEPLEELIVDVAAEHAGAVTAEVSRRRGVLTGQAENADGSMRLTFDLTTRGLLGLRSQLLTLSRGTAILNSLFKAFVPVTAALPKLRNGVLVASDTGKAVTYGLNIAQGRGTTFIPPSTQVYEGMIVGLNSRDSDLEINVTKEKKLTNMRASGSDENILLTPFTNLSLEECLDFLEDDELLEVTPQHLRLRKRLLTAAARARARK